MGKKWGWDERQIKVQILTSIDVQKIGPVTERTGSPPIARQKLELDWRFCSRRNRNWPKMPCGNGRLGTLLQAFYTPPRYLGSGFLQKVTRATKLVQTSGLQFSLFAKGWSCWEQGILDQSFSCRRKFNKEISTIQFSFVESAFAKRKLKFFKNHEDWVQCWKTANELKSL